MTQSSAHPRQVDGPSHVELTEAAALGAAILNPAALAGMVDQLAADDFQREGHRQVFLTLAEMHAAEIHVDQITTSDALVESGRIEIVGGLSAPFDLASIDCCPTPSAWPSYLEIIRREVSRRREIRDHLDALRDLGLDVEVAP